MNNILNFIRLDFQSIKQYLTIKQLGLYTVIILFLTYTMDNLFFVIGMIMMYGLFYAAYPFAIGDKSQTDILYASLPLKKQHIVAGRYLFALCINVITGVTALLLSGVIAIAFQKEFDLLSSGLTILICFFFYTIMVACQFPIYFKLGYTKAKVMTMLPLLLIPLLVIAVTSIVKNDVWKINVYDLFIWAEQHVLLVIFGLILLLACLFLASARLSYQIYRKRDL